jgi:hypothetical protein
MSFCTNWGFSGLTRRQGPPRYGATVRRCAYRRRSDSVELTPFPISPSTTLYSPKVQRRGEVTGDGDAAGSNEGADDGDGAGEAKAPGDGDSEGAPFGDVVASGTTRHPPVG